MARKRIAPEVTIWTDAAHAPTLGQAMELMGSAVRPIGVGGPRTAQVDALSRQLACDREDDFRKLLVDRPAAFVLLGAWRGLSREDVQSALAQGSTILALEPVAATLDALPPIRPRVAAGAGSSGAAAPPVTTVLGKIILIPAFTLSPGWSAAAEPQQVVGRPQAIRVFSSGAEQDWSLFARLYDAWRAVLTFTDLPETIDASLTGPLTETPEDLRSLTGHVCAHARITNACAAVLQTSDRTAKHERALRILGDQAILDVTDTSYQLRSRDGQLVDESPPIPAAHVATASRFADLIAAQWRRLLDQDRNPSASGSSAGETDARVLACCLASQLSARTAGPESPRKLLQMHGIA